MVQALYIHQYQLILLMAVASDSSDYVVMINITSNFSWLEWKKLVCEQHDVKPEQKH